MTGEDRLTADRTLWTMKDIAANLYYGEQTIRGYRKARKLPDPDLTPGGRPLWYAGTIRRWAMDTGRMDPDGKVSHLTPPGRPRRVETPQPPAAGQP